MLQSMRASMLVASDVPQDTKPHMQPSPTLTKVKAIIQSHLKIISKWRKPSPKTTISSPKQTPNDTVVLGSDSFVDKFDEDGDRPPDHTVSCDDVTLVKEPVTVAPTSTEDMVYVDSTTGQVTIRSTNITQHVVPQPTSVVNNTHAIPQPSNVNNNITKVDRGYTEFTGWINETHDVINTVESNILTEIRSLKDNNQRCINNLQSKVDSMLGRINDQQKQINTLTTENTTLHGIVNTLVQTMNNYMTDDKQDVNTRGQQPHPSTNSNHIKTQPVFVDGNPGVVQPVIVDGNPRVVQSNSHTDHVRISDSSPTTCSSSSHVSDNQQPSSHDPNRRRDKPSIILLTDSTGKHIHNDLFLGDTKTAIRRMSTSPVALANINSWINCDQTTGVIVHVGVNDLQNGLHPDQATRSIISLMEACKANYPKARIIYSSIVNNATDDLAARAIEVNRRVHEYCNSDSAFSLISHNISVEHFVDHVHINNGSGTKIFVAQVTGAVRSGLRTQNDRQHHEPPGYQQRPHQHTCTTNVYGNRHQPHNRDNRYGNINRQQPRHDNRPNKYQQQYTVTKQSYI